MKLTTRLIKSFTTTILAITLAGTLALSGCTSTGSSSSNGSSNTKPKASVNQKQTQPEKVARVSHNRSHVRRTGEIYLMRGLLNVFSRGMDTMASRMRSKGLDAVSFNHGNWHTYADDIIARSKRKAVSYPIIIMGHSLGGNEAPQMANYLARHGVKTRLVIAFDPTEPQVVGKNIRTVINYYLPNGRNTIRKTSGFKGSLKNVNVSDLAGIKHTNVEKNRALQRRSISKVIALTKPTKKKRKTASKKSRKKKSSS